MSLDIKSSLDAVKRQALLVIVKSIKIPYVNLSNDLFAYMSTDNSTFNTLLDRLNFNAAIFSSTQVSAMWLLAYLDFYALYTIMVSNYSVFAALKSVSEGKYKYVYTLYKELNRVVNNKKILQDYSYGFYNNFLYPKDINATASRVTTRNGKLTNILETFPAVTLPARSTKEVLPTSLTFFTNDQAISDVESDSDTNYLKYSILRYQNNKISIVRKIEPAKNGIMYSRNTPEITGTIAGYFTDTIYIKVVESTRDTKDEAVIKIAASTNNVDWSSDLTVKAGVATKLTIEGDIELGLLITLYDHCSLAADDRWILTIQHMNIEPPSVEVQARFGMLEPVSFITYMDTSIYKLDIISSVIRPRRFDSYEVPAKVYDGRIGHIAVCNGQVNTYITKLVQNDFDIISKDGRLANKYDFKITDIKGYQCLYDPHGAITFNATPVETITSVAMEADSYVQYYGMWNSEDMFNSALPQSFVEFNLVAETKLSHAIIPLLPKNFLKSFVFHPVATMNDMINLSPDNAKPGEIVIITDDTVVANRGSYIVLKDYLGGDWWNPARYKKYSEDVSAYIPIVFESVVPSKIEIQNELQDFGSVQYTPRFPVDMNYEINNTGIDPYFKAYDNYLKNETEYFYDNDGNYVLFGEYHWKHGYSCVYPVKLWSISDTANNDHTAPQWIQASAGIYYLYYFDEFNDVHLALREFDQGNKILRTFTGNVSGQIEMRSMDDASVTPMVFDYKLEYI